VTRPVQIPPSIRLGAFNADIFILLRRELCLYTPEPRRSPTPAPLETRFGFTILKLKANVEESEIKVQTIERMQERRSIRPLTFASIPTRRGCRRLQSFSHHDLKCLGADTSMTGRRARKNGRCAFTRQSSASHENERPKHPGSNASGSPGGCRYHPVRPLVSGWVALTPTKSLGPMCRALESEGVHRSIELGIGVDVKVHPVVTIRDLTLAVNAKHHPIDDIIASPMLLPENVVSGISKAFKNSVDPATGENSPLCTLQLPHPSCADPSGSR